MTPDELKRQHDVFARYPEVALRQYDDTAPLRATQRGADHAKWLRDDR